MASSSSDAWTEQEQQLLEEGLMRQLASFLVHALEHDYYIQ